MHQAGYEMNYISYASTVKYMIGHIIVLIQGRVEFSTRDPAKSTFYLSGSMEKMFLESFPELGSASGYQSFFFGMGESRNADPFLHNLHILNHR